MSYINMNHTLTKPIQKYVDDHWVNSKKAGFVKKEILARVAHLGLIPASFVFNALDTIIGVGAAGVTVLTLGLNERTGLVTGKHLNSSKKLFAGPYLNLLKTINPKAEVDESIDSGFLSRLVSDILKEIATDFTDDNKNVFSKHVVSRALYALAGLSSLVTRVADGIISVPVVCISLLTLGKFSVINDLAYTTLQAPGVVNDFIFSTIKVINPFVPEFMG